MSSTPVPSLHVSASIFGPDRAGVLFRPPVGSSGFYGMLGRHGRPPYFPGLVIESGLLISAVGVDRVEQLARALIEAGQKLRAEFYLPSDQP
jgi:hypothetical protein